MAALFDIAAFNMAAIIARQLAWQVGPLEDKGERAA